MTSPFASAVKQLPLTLGFEDQKGLAKALAKLEERVAGYRAQGTVLFLLQRIDALPSPEFGFDVSVDTDDDTYFLYHGGSAGIEVEETQFEDEDAMWAFRENMAPRLEQMCAELNDSDWRTDGFTCSLVEALNEVQWRKPEVEQVLADALDEQGVDGQAFIASLRAGQQAKILQASTVNAGQVKRARKSL